MTDTRELAEALEKAVAGESRPGLMSGWGCLAPFVVMFVAIGFAVYMGITHAMGTDTMPTAGGGGGWRLGLPGSGSGDWSGFHLFLFYGAIALVAAVGAFWAAMKVQARRWARQATGALDDQLRSGGLECDRAQLLAIAIAESGRLQRANREQSRYPHTYVALLRGLGASRTQIDKLVPRSG